MILSLGYGNRDLPDLLALLEAFRVDVLADVRSQPWSRFRPELNCDSLAQRLVGLDIRYRFLGDRLGGRPGNPALYTPDGYVDYAACRRDPEYAAAFSGLLDLEARGQTVCLLCAELRPQDCHRSRLIGHGLLEQGHVMSHIDEHGALLDQQQLEGRLDGGQLGLLERSPAHPLNRGPRLLGPPARPGQSE